MAGPYYWIGIIGNSYELSHKKYRTDWAICIFLNLWFAFQTFCLHLKFCRQKIWKLILRILEAFFLWNFFKKLFSLKYGNFTFSVLLSISKFNCQKCAKIERQSLNNNENEVTRPSMRSFKPPVVPNWKMVLWTFNSLCLTILSPFTLILIFVFYHF